MNTNINDRRDPNPRKNASVLSKVLFFYTFPTFKKGFKGDLKEDNIYETLESNAASKLGDRLEKLWQTEVLKPNPCLVKPLFRMFWLEYIALGVGVFAFETVLLLSQPILMGRVIAYFEEGQQDITRDDALVYSAGLVGCILMWQTFNSNYLFLLEQLSMRIRIACCSLMYRKCLKLNLNTTPQSEYGKIVTMMTKDVTQFNGATDMLHVISEGILHMMIMSYLMYRQMGVSTFSGVSLLVVILVFHVYMGKLTAKYRLQTAGKTDERVRVTQEVFTAIRIIKMYTWERLFSRIVGTLRRKEIGSLRILFIIKAIALSVGELSGMLAFYVCVMTYIALGNHITVERAYVVVGCFATLRQVLTVSIPLGIAQIAELIASLKRITTFLQLEEVAGGLDFQEDILQQSRILVKGVTVESRSGYKILQDINVDIKSGMTLITGTVGSGKSTLLELLLGDIKESSGSVKISGAVAYASPEPWVFPGTVKQNILFSEKYSERRYEKVIEICALKEDLDNFPLGDKTCLTDRGLNLSRGQKARINLARAIYKKADIYLLDDCLSSVDTHVANHIFEKCLKDFLKHRIRILVTHQMQFMSNVSNIIILNKGRVSYQGNHGDLQTLDNVALKNIINQSNKVVDEEIIPRFDIKAVSDEANNIDEDSKLIISDTKERNVYEEIKQEGSVKMTVYYQYFTSGGGMWILLIAVFFSITAQIASSWSDYSVSHWIDTEQGLSGFRYNQTTNSPEYKQLEESRGSVLTLYSLVILAATTFILCRSFTYFIFSSRASRNLHKLAFEKIMNATMTFFDVNLSGNVINRFTRDLAIIDEQTAFVIFNFLRSFLSFFAVLLVVSTVNVLFLIPSAIFAIILYFAQRVYLPTGRTIRRMEGATRSPVVGHLSATLEGLTTIRARRAQSILKEEFDRYQDVYYSVSYMNLATTRAFLFYLEALSAFFMAAVTLTFLFGNPDTLAGKVGLAISQTFSLTGILQAGVRQWVELETQMTSTERVLEYTNIEAEKKSGDTIANWPTAGQIVYKDVSLRYSPTSERVLKNVSFIIKPKEKVGIVGRTGAGKTSIISTLFRLYAYEGAILIDGTEVNKLEVEQVRSIISIIPQEPILFSGSIRNNLDPNGIHSETELWSALEDVNVKHLIDSLDVSITEGGSNFSTGQRQLICLARAVLNKNAILVLDEATANVDPQTDSLIHKTIQRKFNDCTVITIAHRLHTILDHDKVLVMDLGRAIEFDAPGVLLKNKNGLLYNMVKEAGLL